MAASFQLSSVLVLLDRVEADATGGILCLRRLLGQGIELKNIISDDPMENWCLVHVMVSSLLISANYLWTGPIRSPSISFLGTSLSRSNLQSAVFWGYHRPGNDVPGRPLLSWRIPDLLYRLEYLEKQEEEADPTKDDYDASEYSSYH
eukprot:CAMPEP_0170492792 /NCGR_PEP_ID=MMETSP0208-20121228/12856_1 /TAXON_ID=197538 /ORGANISM="Strombidium inclinatum, Strain S3" /LENGTH=147 /DNA_ID=CAMNT_0010768601 /DNA_START=460 /DNA_END=903 /DNA_ORIENTATION=-